jgi:uncharacterized protein (TIGR03067 family)
MMLTTTLAATAFALLAVHAAADDRPAAGGDAAGQLTGLYRITAGERDGQKIPEGELAGVTVRIATNAITTLDKDKKEVYVATYKLDTSRTPWRIVLTATVTPMDAGKGTEAEGLIAAAAGDTVKFIYALPGGTAPTDFKAKDKQQLFVLTKVKP